MNNKTTILYHRTTIYNNYNSSLRFLKNNITKTNTYYDHKHTITVMHSCIQSSTFLFQFCVPFSADRSHHFL